MNPLSIIYSLLFLAVSSVLAAPLDVYAPPVTSPNATTVWTVGQVTNITWDASNPPAHITNPNGFILLGKAGQITPAVLANNVNVTQGWTQITVPFVYQGGDYFVTFFGDSGDSSPSFTINSPVNI